MLKKAAENSVLHEELQIVRGKLEVSEREIAQLHAQLSKILAKNNRSYNETRLSINPGSRQSMLQESRQSLFQESRQSIMHVSNEGSIGRLPQMRGSMVRASIFAINVEELQEADKVQELLFQVDQGKKRLNDARIALRKNQKEMQEKDSKIEMQKQEAKRLKEENDRLRADLNKADERLREKIMQNEQELVKKYLGEIEFLKEKLTAVNGSNTEGLLSASNVKDITRRSILQSEVELGATAFVLEKRKLEDKAKALESEVIRLKEEKRGTEHRLEEITLKLGVTGFAGVLSEENKRLKEEVELWKLRAEVNDG